jgi:hypothetical protein
MRIFTLLTLASILLGAWNTPWSKVVRRPPTEQGITKIGAMLAITLGLLGTLISFAFAHETPPDSITQLLVFTVGSFSGDTLSRTVAVARKRKTAEPPQPFTDPHVKPPPIHTKTSL